MRDCLEIGNYCNDDNNYDNSFWMSMIIIMIIFWVRIIIVTMTYGNADDDQGYSHRKDWVWIIYDEIGYVSLGILK